MLPAGESVRILSESRHAEGPLIMPWKLARVTLLALFVVGASISAQLAQVCNDDDVAGEILVELVPGVSVDDVAAAYGLTPLEGITQLDFWRMDVGQGDAEAILDAMEGDADVVAAEPHNLFETPEGIQISIPDIEVGATPQDVRDQPAGDLIHTDTQTVYTGSGIVVAVPDTGISLSHPELVESLINGGIDMLGGNTTAEAIPYGEDMDADGEVDESLHHSTFVAGLIRLVAPDVRILPVRILDAEGRGTAFALARGIVHAADQGVDILNLSLSVVDPCDSTDELIARALEYAAASGVVVIAAAGNRGLPVVDFPANLDETIAVAAVGLDLTKTGFSNYGSEIDLSAPGLDLLSLYGDGEFARWSGTSFAAPLVSGAVALLLQKYPCLDRSEVRDLLAATTQPDANPGLAGRMGAGVLDARAMAQALIDAHCLAAREAPQTGTIVSWSPILGAVSYDVARGDVGELQETGDAVDLGSLWCVTNDATTTEALPDGDVPAAGSAYFYLFRTDDGEGYGTDAAGKPRLPGLGDCSEE